MSENPGTEATSDLHDMGGNIGPASVRAAGATAGSRQDREASPDSGYARDLGPTTGRDEEQPNVAGSDESGYAAGAPPVTAGAPSNYVEIDADADQTGRGADGDTSARLEQKHSE